MCDHTIGYLHDWVLASEVSQILKNEAFGWNNYSKAMNGLARANEKPLKEDYRPIDFLDGRKGYMNMFKFCPDCGEKINWKDIKKEI